MGLSVAATLLAVVLVVGLLAWVRRDLQVRGAPMRVWWLVVACYAFAAIAWLVAITIPLPIMVAWLATIPAAVATVIPERLADTLGSVGRVRRGRRTGRPLSVSHRSGARHAMAHPIDQPKPVPRAGLVRRRATTPARPSPRPASMPLEASARADPSATSAPYAGAATPPSLPPPQPRKTPAFGRHRWHAGDLRLAIELLEDVSRIPDLDDAARERIDGRLDRLDRFRDAATAELLDLVRDDVHARLASEAPTIDPDPTRAQRIATLLDELDPRPAGGST